MKKMMVGIVGAAALLSATAFADTLSLNSQNMTNPITVKCGASRDAERDTGMPIPTDGQRSIHYFLVRILLGSPLYCDFYDGSADIGYAKLTISDDYMTAQINDFSFDQTHYNVAISSGSYNPLPVNTSAKDISVMLTKL